MSPRPGLSAPVLIVAALGGCAGVRPEAGATGAAGAGGGTCIDLDGDGFGPGCASDFDCDDHDPSVHYCPGGGIGDPGWVAHPDGGAPDVFVPPSKETPVCPAGTRRIHVKDMWSRGVDPTLAAFDRPPLAVVIADVTHNWLVHNARKETVGCDWYSDCLPATTAAVTVAPIDPTTGCSANQLSPSGNVDVTQAGAGDVYIDYGGTSAALPSDYAHGALRVTGDPAAAGIAVCAPGLPDTSTPAGFTKVHVRWPWGDPDKTGFPGTACDAQKGYATPPYPSSLAVNAGGGVCVQPLLEFQDGHCPWYTVLIPNARWKAGATFQMAYPDFSGLQSAPLTLPERAADEYWVGFAGPPDTPACLNYSTRPDSYRWYTRNPGPGYAGCGGDGSVPIDPCNPQPPANTSVIHFRYVWAGQKTFTYFPRPELMPRWIVLEVTGATAEVVTCWREADRPWFNCPVPNEFFGPGRTWRAVDKTRSPTEWNTVEPRPMPATPGEYWLRWYYGKPDTPVPAGFAGASKQTDHFRFYDYYPDGTNGDWSATGSWNDSRCAPKPPAVPPVVGLGGWFPYDRTGYSYPFGASLAKTYAASGTVQALFNALVFDRYKIWKQNYVSQDALACGQGAARVTTDPPATVSEGQGYGMAMAAAIGDKELFGQLWTFVRQHLSQSAKKYCGGLMAWMTDGGTTCRPLDQPCDPDVEACGGNGDSAFDGDVDIGIGLVFAARQWPEYLAAATGWLLKMECEVNTAYDGRWSYPAPGDTFDKNCAGYPGQPCSYTPGFNGRVNMSYYPPGYFRVFGDFLAASLAPSAFSAAERARHHEFWYRTAETVWEMVERCYAGGSGSVSPALFTDWGHYDSPCDANADNYNWSRALWRVSVDAAWFGDRGDLPENAPGSSRHDPGKTQMQAKLDNIQRFYAGFSNNNPVVPNANRFSTICQNLQPDGTVTNCDPGFGHNSYFVNTAMCAFATRFADGGRTTPEIRREAIEEAVTTTIENDRYYQESIGVYTLMFLTGNFPNPMAVP